MAKSRPRKTNKRNPVQFTRGKNIFKGFILTWTDPNPLSRKNEITDSKVSHTNPVLRPSAVETWRVYSESVLKNHRLLWKITMTAYFPYAKGSMEREEQIQVVGKMAFKELAVNLEPHLDDICKSGPNLDRVFFKVECLGDRKKQLSDYDEGFEPEGDSDE